MAVIRQTVESSLLNVAQQLVAALQAVVQHSPAQLQVVGGQPTAVAAPGSVRRSLRPRRAAPAILDNSSSSSSSSDEERGGAGDGEFVIESIVDSRGRGSRAEYRVRWAGYSALHDTWESAASLQDTEALAQFRSSRRSRSRPPRKQPRTLKSHSDLYSSSPASTQLLSASPSRRRRLQPPGGLAGWLLDRDNRLQRFMLADALHVRALRLDAGGRSRFTSSASAVQQARGGFMLLSRWCAQQGGRLVCDSELPDWLSGGGDAADGGGEDSQAINEPSFDYVARVGELLHSLGFAPVGIEQLVGDAGAQQQQQQLVRSAVRSYQLQGAVAICAWLSQALCAVNRTQTPAMALLQRTLIALRRVRCMASLQEASTKLERRRMLAQLYGDYRMMRSRLMQLGGLLADCWARTWRLCQSVGQRSVELAAASCGTAAVSLACQQSLLKQAEQAFCLLFVGGGGVFPLRCGFAAACRIAIDAPTTRGCNVVYATGDAARLSVAVGLAQKQKSHVIPSVYLPPPAHAALATLLEACPGLASHPITDRAASAIQTHLGDLALQPGDVDAVASPHATLKLRPSHFRRIYATLLYYLLLRRLITPHQFAASAFFMCHSPDTAITTYCIAPSLETLLQANAPARLRRLAADAHVELVGAPRARSAIRQPRNTEAMSSLLAHADLAWQALRRFIATCQPGDAACVCEQPGCGAALHCSELAQHACYLNEARLFSF